MKDQTLKALEAAGIQNTALLVKRRTDMGVAQAYYTEAGEYVDDQGEVLTIDAEQAKNGAVVIRAGESIGVFSLAEAGMTADDPRVTYAQQVNLPAFDKFADAEYIGVTKSGNIVSLDDNGKLTDYFDGGYDEYDLPTEQHKDENWVAQNMVFIDADENIVVDPAADKLSVQQVRERLIANKDKLVGNPHAFLEAVLEKFQSAIEGADAEYPATGSMRDAILLKNTLTPMPEDAMPQDGVRLSPVHEKQTKEEFLRAHPTLNMAIEGTKDLGTAMMPTMGDAIYNRARMIYAGATQTPMKDVRMSTGFYDETDYDSFEGESYSASEIFKKVVNGGAKKVPVSAKTSDAVAGIYGRAPNSGEGSVQIDMADLDGMTFMLVNDGMSGDIVYSWPTTPYLISDADYIDELEYIANPPAEDADPAQPAPGQGFY